MNKYSVTFIMDGGNDTVGVSAIVESSYDFDAVTSQIVKELNDADLFIVDRDPEYNYSSKEPGKVIIRSSKVINVVVRKY